MHPDVDAADPLAVYRVSNGVEEPAFLDELPPGTGLPPHFTLASARELRALRLKAEAAEAARCRGGATPSQQQ